MKPLKDLTLADDFMFKHVMDDTNIVKLLLEAIFNKKVSYINNLSTQKDISGNPDQHGVILDVFFEGDNTLYNIEMQRGRGDIIKRVRYYQSSMDRFTLSSGCSYRDLKDTVIIFICTYDPFGAGEPFYYKQSSIVNAPNYTYNDGTVTLFLNSAYKKPTEMNESLRDFLSIVNGSTLYSTLLGKSIQERINHVKTCEEVAYSMFYDSFGKGREEGYEEGREEGYKEGCEEGLEKEKIKKVDSIVTKLFNVYSVEELSYLVDEPISFIQERITALGLSSNTVEPLKFD